jgi:hypothetical protein
MNLWQQYKAECAKLPRWIVYALFVFGFLCALACYEKIQEIRHPGHSTCPACTDN